MTARSTILAAIRQARPDAVPLPDVPSFSGRSPEDPSGRFADALRAAGGTVMDGRGREVGGVLAGVYPEAPALTTLPPLRLPSVRTLATDASAAELAEVDVLVVEATLGVAESGAVWLADPSPRAAPFLAQHVAVVLPVGRLVTDLHDAYAAIGPAGGFGLFVAGPSKTADIEQALVVGAHGPRSLVVVLV